MDEKQKNLGPTVSTPQGLAFLKLNQNHTWRVANAANTAQLHCVLGAQFGVRAAKKMRLYIRTKPWPFKTKSLATVGYKYARGQPWRQSRPYNRIASVPAGKNVFLIALP